MKRLPEARRGYVRYVDDLTPATPAEGVAQTLPSGVIKRTVSGNWTVDPDTIDEALVVARVTDSGGTYRTVARLYSPAGGSRIDTSFSFDVLQGRTWLWAATVLGAATAGVQEVKYVDEY